jgi:hypothetical protein
MPSLLHEGLILLVRDRPELAAKILVDLLGVEVPRFTEARLTEAALPEIVPVEYFADAIVLFADGAPVFGAIFEAQLQPDPRKLFTWPFYAVAARARHECPFVVVVATADPDTARWAARPIDLGNGVLYHVHVIGPEGVPIVTDREHAVREPYLAMLSVMAHGQGDRDTAVAVARATAEAILKLRNEDQRLLYWAIVLRSLGEAARKAFEMLPDTYEFLSESMRRSLAEGMAKGLTEGKAEGKAEGRAEGRAEDILRILAKRRIAMIESQRQRILDERDLALLDRWFDRALTVAAIDELFE